MTRDETAKVLTMVAARYPSAKLWDQDEALTVCMWHLSLADMPYPAIERALFEWMQFEKWSPDPSELRAGANALMARCTSDEEREALEPGWKARKEAQGQRKQLNRVYEPPMVNEPL